MQAIILAAGMGRRLGKYTQDNTKCMVEVNGVKLIDRLLRQLLKVDLSRVIIVVGYKGDNLKQYITSHYANSKLNIEFYDNPIYDKTNNIYSLWLVRKQMEEDETLLIESDLIFSDRMIPMIVNDKRPNIALVAKYETWMDGTMVCLDDDNHITNFVSKRRSDMKMLTNTTRQSTYINSRKTSRKTYTFHFSTPTARRWETTNTTNRC